MVTEQIINTLVGGAVTIKVIETGSDIIKGKKVKKQKITKIKPIKQLKKIKY